MKKAKLMKEVADFVWLTFSMLEDVHMPEGNMLLSSNLKINNYERKYLMDEYF